MHGATGDFGLLFVEPGWQSGAGIDGARALKTGPSRCEVTLEKPRIEAPPRAIACDQFRHDGEIRSPVETL